MSDLLTTSSRPALAATVPEVFARVDKDYVELRLLYEAFAPEKVEIHELQWREGTTLADYMEGLPEEAGWMVFHNGEEVELADAADITISQEDRIGLIMVPLGGQGGFKNILRVALQIAAIALAFIPGIGWALALAINVGIALINAFLLTPKPPKNSNADDSRSYGIDGAKNSATEGIPYPVVYGEYRTAGNYADCYTENLGDNQYLYLRAVLNDGLIDSVSDIEINEQPLESFKDVTSRISLGSLTEEVNDWFKRSIVQTNKNMKLESTWTHHITTTSVDKVRFDIMFPNGLVDIKEKDGTYRNKSVIFETEYRAVDGDTHVPLGDGSWADLNTTASSSFDNTTTAGPVNVNAFDDILLSVALQASTGIVVTAAPTIEYRETGTGDWLVGGIIDIPTLGGYAFDSVDPGTIVGPTDVSPLVNQEFLIPLPPGDYEVRPTGDSTVITSVVAYPVTGAPTVTVTDKRTRQIRKSFESTQLAQGFYEVRIRRTTATSTDQYKVDEVWLTDVAEIELDPVAFRGTANLSLRVKLTEQLNAIPGLTSKVKGSVLQEYDIDGVPTIKRWSANPAWIGLDILCGIERGAGLSTSRIDWPRWIEFAEYCDANSLTFNGIFDTGTNMGDALNQVLRIGQAAPVPFGTKISVAIDRERDPVTAFTQAGMISKTFQVTYMSMQDRANEFEISYYDKTDRNKQKTIRYVDPKAVTFNEVPRVASVSLVGVDNLLQARAELWRMIYANRLLIRTVTFDAWMESINLSLGEVALLQHDMMEWANSGRLIAGSTDTAVKLDQLVTTDVGEDYSLLVHFSAMKRADVTVSSIVGKKVLVTGSSIAALKVARFIVGAQDFEVVKVQDGSPYHTITLATTPTGFTGGAAGELWDTDVVEERAVSSVATNAEGTTTVTLESALTGAPDGYSNFVFGRVANVRKPYVLTGISGTGIEKRKLTFMEYHDGVYAGGETDIPIPVAAVTDRVVSHVGGLLFDYERLVKANQELINVRLHWSAAGIRNYGGADIYMSLNGGSFRPVASAANVSEYTLQLAPNDIVVFRANAYNRRGDRAPETTTPGVSGTLACVFATLDEPTDFTATTIAFQVDGKVLFEWVPPVDTTGIQNYEVQYRRSVDSDWTSVAYSPSGPVEVSGLPTGSYVGRVRSSSVTSTSVWVEQAFTVVVVPGSLMENFNSSNDQNAAAVVAPTLPVTPVSHVANTDGSATVVFEWVWSGDEEDIDGFIVTVTDTPPA